MRNKRFLSMFLAGAMSLVMAVPAFANGVEQTIDSRVDSPTVNVEVLGLSGNKTTVLLNPYKMEYERPNVNEEQVVDDRAVMFTPVVIENKTDLDLKISATTKAAVSSGITLLAPTESKDTNGNITVTLPDVTKDTKKNVFMYLEAKQSNTEAAAKDLDNGWEGAYAAKANQIYLKTADNKKTDMITLPAVAPGTASNYVSFILQGDASPAPATDWVAADKVDVTVAFTFTPTIGAKDITKKINWDGTTSTLTSIISAQINDANATPDFAFKQVDSQDVKSMANAGITNAGAITLDTGDVLKALNGGPSAIFDATVVYKKATDGASEKTGEKTVRIRIYDKQPVITDSSLTVSDINGTDFDIDLTSELLTNPHGTTPAWTITIDNPDDDANITGIASIANSKITLNATKLAALAGTIETGKTTKLTGKITYTNIGDIKITRSIEITIPGTQ